MSWRAQGMRTWIVQRLTALYMLIYLPGFFLYIGNSSISDFTSWQNLFVHPLVNILTGFFFFSVLYHAWVGIRDIMIDYVKWSPLRFMLWVLVTSTIIGLAVWVIMILFSVVKV